MPAMFKMEIGTNFTLTIPDSTKDILPILSCGDTSTEIPIETICQMWNWLGAWVLREDVRRELSYQTTYNYKSTELLQYEEEILDDYEARRQDDTSWHDDFMASLSTVAERHGIRV